ncbi:MAG: peptidoglycan DD-metalloendopeptidase family protein [Bacillota bacterium]|nr:peptidoglycan DD-metalloendopeptidase family protein [Bacillota bacterium]
MKKLRVPLAIMTVLLFLSQVLIPVSANELDKLRQQQQENSRQIQQQEKQLQQTQKQVNAVSSEISRLEQNIDWVKRDIESLKVQLAKTEAQVVETEMELLEAEERQQQRLEVLSARLKEVFINGQVNYMEVILQASSINDLLTRMVMLEKIMEQDMALLDEIEAERQIIEEKKVSLEQKREEIVAIKLDTERKEKDLLVKTRQRQEWLVSLESDAAAIEKALDELEALDKEIEKMLQAALANSKGEGITKPASWPVPGYQRVSSDYGMRLHPILRTRRMHTGIDIAAPSGVNIVATDFGTVVYADWLGGYGKTVIIDHGKGMSSLYAHQSTILVKVGDEVARGDVIGKIGSTGQSTGPHLHFEVRINGTHTNPWAYLR